MKTFQFKKLEINQETNWKKRFFSSERFRKTLLFSVIGAIAGYLLFYFGQAEIGLHIWNDEAFKNILMGTGIGIFLTNSPCARGRC